MACGDPKCKTCKAAKRIYTFNAFSTTDAEPEKVDWLYNNIKSPSGELRPKCVCGAEKSKLPKHYDWCNVKNEKS